VDRRSTAGVALIEAACARETVAPEYSVSGPAGPGRLLISADGFTKGWIWGAAAREKNGSITPKHKTVTIPLPVSLLENTKAGKKGAF